MATDISEKGLEDIIVNHLRDVGGYRQGASADYDRTYVLLPAAVEQFLQATQPQKVEELRLFATAVERRNSSPSCAMI